MMKNPFLFPVFLTALVLLGGCAKKEPIAVDSGIKLEIGPVAPAWKLTDLAGKTVSSDEFKGKVMIVDFWATWCPPCVQEIPGYIEMQKKYAAKGLVIVGVSLDQQGPGVVKKFADSKGMNYPIVMGDETVVSAFGGIEAIPTTFLINREGRIVHHKVGGMDHAEYEKFVQAALK